MENRKTQWVWVKGPEKARLKPNGKARILKQANEIISATKKLKRKVSRVATRGAWVYLYELVEQHKAEGVIFAEPLIDGKYLEFHYARITIRNETATNCDLDWQRHNGQWMTLYSGTLQECLEHIENNDEWFQ